MNNRDQKLQTGSSLIEVMIALLVLGVGLLGMLSLQNQAMKFSQTALYDSQARYAISDIVERVRIGTKIDATNAAYYALSKDSSATDPTSNHCDAGNCSAKQLAAWDVWQWLSALKSTLPSGKAEIKFDPTKNELTVSVFYSTANLNQAVSSSAGQVADDPTERRISVATRIK